MTEQEYRKQFKTEHLHRWSIEHQNHFMQRVTAAEMEYMEMLWEDGDEEEARAMFEEIWKRPAVILYSYQN